jgi:hypothetical protein
MVISLCCCGRNISEPDKIIDFSKMHQPPGVKVLSGNNGSQNKNGNNGGGSATYSGFSADRLNDEFSGILSFN